MRHLIIPDPHSTPGKSNRRAEWAGKLILDRRPDVVIVLGDVADMGSLCSYDKGKKSFIGRTYAKDIECHGDFQERLWGTVRKGKRKMPRRVALIGNHEQRIDRAIEVQSELEGIIGYKDLALNHFYDEVVHYEGSTPGSIDINGVTYAHYLVSGVSCRPIGGDNSARAILNKKHSSCVVGHSHMFDHSVSTRQNGKKIMALSAGCYQEHASSFAGEANRLWWRGVTELNNVDNGTYDINTFSLEHLRKEYS